ncbi:unnamed protein product [Lymnaea stagnalis]|uniref:Sulfatase N-terminal domain-containing protein n=1 Tax=Lymnaea stagnalis TaxID=6523 RepID=A0AAV2H5F1_LYMST
MFSKIIENSKQCWTTVFNSVSLLFVILIQQKGCVLGSQPNILLILADDLGWDDVGFHGSEILTPYIDKLAQEGVILNNYYVQPICTPSRGALLSGKYPIHTGLQHYVIAGSQPYGLPLTEITLAQHLRSLGYSTHAIGKWHLGFFKNEYLPENRGFDSHYGYYLGKGDYFDHYSNDGGFMGLDIHQNGRPVWNETEIYSTDLFTEKAKSVIRTHDKSKPLFLYLAFQAVHAGNKGDLIQAPQKYIDRFPKIKNIKRRMFAGVVSALDDSVGSVYRALVDAGMENNTVIVFSTDNGGPANGYDGNAACNWPLRGTKNTLWQGGVRGVGFVHSQLLKKNSYVNNNLMHVVDWLPTLIDIAGGDVSVLGNIDGIDQWKSISENEETSRQEVLLNIDPVMKHEALIVGDFKIIFGDISNGHYDGWYPPPTEASIPELGTFGGNNLLYYYNILMEYLSGNQSNLNGYSKTIDEIQKSDVADLIHVMNAEYTLLKEVHKQTYSLSFLPNSQLKLNEQRSNKIQTKFVHFEQQIVHDGKDKSESPAISTFSVHCGVKPENASINCQPEKAPCLYHLRDDPCEYNNLATSLPITVQQLMARLNLYRDTMIPPANKPIDPNGNPQLHGGVWGPWM